MYVHCGQTCAIPLLACVSQRHERKRSRQRKEEMQYQNLGVAKKQVCISSVCQGSITRKNTAALCCMCHYVGLLTKQLVCTVFAFASDTAPFCDHKCAVSTKRPWLIKTTDHNL